MNTITKPNSSTERNAYRHAILMQLSAARPASLIIDVIDQGLRLTGFNYHSRSALEQEIDYLCQKQLIRQTHAVLSPGVKRYKITDLGQDHLETESMI